MRAIDGFLPGLGLNGRRETPAVESPQCGSGSSTRSHVRRSSAWDAADTERDKLVVRLLADTGIRLGELRALRPDDVPVEGGKNVLKVRGKGGGERLVPLSPSLARRLKRFADRARGEASSDRLFLLFSEAWRQEDIPRSRVRGWGPSTGKAHEIIPPRCIIDMRISGPWHATW
jgi:integrase